MLDDIYTMLALGICAVFVGLFAMQFVRNSRAMTLWHGLALGAGSLFAIAIVNNYTLLLDWVALGMAGASAGAALFILGMVAMCFVMAWNFLATKGMVLVR